VGLLLCKIAALLGLYFFGNTYDYCKKANYALGYRV